MNGKKTQWEHSRFRILTFSTSAATERIQRDVKIHNSFSTLINLHLMMTMIMKMYWAVNRSCKLCYVLHMRICFILKVEVTLWDGFYYPHTTDEKIGSETLYNLPKFTELTSGLAGIQIQAWFQSWSSFPSLQQKNYMTFFFPIIKSKLPNLSKTRFMLCVL